jgi:5-methyltetrahydropteroyltriglutamate--homocysteine methyltransferase
MKRSTERILTTHVGSLIRPAALRPFLADKEAGRPYDRAAYAECLAESVAQVVEKQAEAGVDIVSDGEFGKAISWSQYGLFRLSGFERRPFTSGGNPFVRSADRKKFPEFYAELDSRDRIETVSDSVCVAPINYVGQTELQQDIDHLKAALRRVSVEDAFLPVAAPASVIPDRKNEFYENDEKLVEAIGAAMRSEYKAITDAGLLLQLDDARAATTYERMVPPANLKDYRKWLARHIEVLNHAIRDLPRDRIRYHVCWGSWPGPHVFDVPFQDIADIVLKVRAGAFSFEMANPRHEHEWQLWKDIRLPDGALLLPGVITHATNIVEHPDLVAERIVRLANLVGRENVVASTDCGFAQVTYFQRVHPSVQWVKLEALAEGARRASKELWRRPSKRLGSKRPGSKRPAAKRAAPKRSGPKRTAAKRAAPKRVAKRRSATRTASVAGRKQRRGAGR